MTKVPAIAAAALALSSSVAFAQTVARPTPEPSSGGLAQPPGIQDRPKVYQPVNPAPDTRTAPTSSTSGIGSESGGHPENQKK